MGGIENKFYSKILSYLCWKINRYVKYFKSLFEQVNSNQIASDLKIRESSEESYEMEDL